MVSSVLHSSDGGLNWTDIETADQCTALELLIPSTWTGGFTSDPNTDGIYKWVFIPSIACNDPSIHLVLLSDPTLLYVEATQNFCFSREVAPSIGDFSE